MRDAGERDTPIVFERFAVQTDAHGGEEEGDWQVYTRAWAAVRVGTGQERREAGQTAAAQAITLRVLANSLTSALTPLDRVATYLGSTWDIAGVAVLDRAEIEITAVRRAESQGR